MIPVLLTRIKTRDNVSLHGIFVRPKQKSAAGKSATALIWIHGLGAHFAKGQTLIRELSAACQKSGIAYVKFNTRGHDIVHRDASKKKGFWGSGFERFEDCVHDIRAMIAHAKKSGSARIILAGHSTGANKALYYLYKTRDRSVKGLVLLGPVSDIAAGRKKFGAAGLARGVALAGKLSRKNPEALMPQSYGIFSARRFLSIFRAGGPEDVFPYLDPHAPWKELKSIRVPIAVIFGSRDEYLDPVRSKTPKMSAAAPSARRTSNGVDRPAQKIIDVFRANAPLAKSFTGAIIKGANHGFKEKEKEVTREIMRWIVKNTDV